MLGMTFVVGAAEAHWWTTLVRPGLQILAIVLVAMIVRLLLHRAIDTLVRTATARAAGREAATSRRGSAVLVQAAGLDRERHRQRVTTTGSLLRSVTSIVVFSLALLTVMGVVGVPLAPLIASAGVGGVALGFGAQSLVRDFLSGIFMIVEDQYGVGDVVDTGNLVGTVEDVSLRITRLRDGSGVVWYVRNGEILRLGNHTQGSSAASVDVPIPLGEDADRVIEILRSTAAELDRDPQWADRMVRAPEVVGVESIADGAYTLRVVLACAPGDADPVARELRARLLRDLERGGIRLTGVIPR